MNGGSTLAYNEKTWEEDRSVTITGEGFFQVKKGSSFVVKTNLGAVTVLGTSFNVKTRNEKLEVVCYTGKVNVASSNTDQNLLPGDGLRVEKGSVTRSWKSDVDSREPSWLIGITLFDEQVPAKEAIDELVNVFGIKVLRNDLSDTVQYKGAFQHSNANNAIRAVLGPFDNQVRYEFDSTNNTLRIIRLNP
jgi:ferric-dicitrate binding protein FerR (iron transport regulator)